jgi:hypothetical protein
VIVRADLPRGVQAAQLVHAAGESSPGGLPEGTLAVVLSAQDEAQLARVHRALVEAGIPIKPVIEPDDPWDGALMAIGVHPVQDRRPVRRILGRLPLLK